MQVFPLVQLYGVTSRMEYYKRLVCLMFHLVLLQHFIHGGLREKIALVPILLSNAILFSIS